jgi:SAM-dependent methyltransferase
MVGSSARRRGSWQSLNVNSTSQTYDRIGIGYGVRRPDPRLAARLNFHLGDAATVLNVGAGTGNYEPVDREVIAVDPSMVMLAQRNVNASPALQARAECLPFSNSRFDAAMAISTVHHWNDLQQGLKELARVAELRVVYFSEPALPGFHWLVDEYFPEVIDMPTNLAAPRAEQVAELLGGTVTVETFEVPADFTDGAGAFWSRPELYCIPEVQAGLSMFALLNKADVQRGTELLRKDLASGLWDERHGHLRTLPTMDVGYRIITSRE